jgi:hypothetical protein
MELNLSSEATSCTITQEFVNILQNAKFNYLVHESPLLIPILS